MHDLTYEAEYGNDKSILQSMRGGEVASSAADADYLPDCNIHGIPRLVFDLGNKHIFKTFHRGNMYCRNPGECLLPLQGKETGLSQMSQEYCISFA